MVNEDQKLRKMGINKYQYDELVKKIHGSDAKNIRGMKTIIKKHGWPGKSLVGKKAAIGAWLLVQHADQDVVFQKKCLALLKKSVQRGEMEKRYIAYLTDRININSNKSQIFGTQFYIDKSGKFGPRQIKDRAKLAKRRKKYGLGSFREYQRKLIKIHEKANNS